MIYINLCVCKRSNKIYFVYIIYERVRIFFIKKVLNKITPLKSILHHIYQSTKNYYILTNKIPRTHTRVHNVP